MSRALVLSGGGAVGIAWQSGLTAGLLDEGVDLREADFVLGTSAGSAVGAQIALRRDLHVAVDRYRAAAAKRSPADDGAPRAAVPATGGGAAMGERMQRLMALMAETVTSDDPPEVVRQKIGAFALEAETVPEDQFISGFRYLDGDGWPAHYACTAVDALSGEFVVWNGQPGVELSAAVASSCAVPGVFPPITINGRRYVDGGMRSGTNADLAKGHDRVLIITLMGGPRDATPDPRYERMRQRSDAELAVLHESGATIESIAPDDEAAAAIGVNLMDGSNSAAAAEAGMAQAKREGERFRALW